MLTLSTRRVALILLTLLFVFIVLRAFLHTYPQSHLTVGPYTIHHLFIGLLLIVAGGLPLAIFHGDNRFLDFAALCFGAGLSMALDQWVYLIATDGSNQSYVAPVSLWGGIAMVAFAVVYLTLLSLFFAKQTKSVSKT